MFNTASELLLIVYKISKYTFCYWQSCVTLRIFQTTLQTSIWQYWLGPCPFWNPQLPPWQCRCKICTFTVEWCLSTHMAWWVSLHEASIETSQSSSSSWSPSAMRAYCNCRKCLLELLTLGSRAWRLGILPVVNEFSRNSRSQLFTLRRFVWVHSFWTVGGQKSSMIFFCHLAKNLNISVGCCFPLLPTRYYPNQPFESVQWDSDDARMPNWLPAP